MSERRLMASDPAAYVSRRAREIQRNQEGADSAIDAQELAEREEAARAYAGENEQHYVDFMMDCLKQSVNGYADVRKTQEDCYRIYKENEPLNYAKKEPWQSRIVIPKPFSTVAYGAAAVKKAFSPNFLSITDSKNAAAAAFWKKVMDNQLNEQNARFRIRFTDATQMGLAVGVSMEMIPRFVPGRGLEYVLTEPWKIHRDPDAISRDNQSGMYWIHQEWIDLYVLKEAEKRGRYFNVDRCAEMSAVGNEQDPFLSAERIAQRKELIYQRSTFRKLIQTQEMWGTILDSKGNMLLPHATYTVAAGRVISLPRTVPYSAVRWPGISFSPLPDLLRFGGRGLLEGIVSVWDAMNNIMCLHHDYLLWLVNPMREVVVDLLVNPEDVKSYPGKEYLVHESVNGQQAVRTVDQRHITNEILANLQYHDQNYQIGTFVPSVVQGLPGYRKDITYREQAQNLDQALGVYALMGENIEAGAIDAIMAGADMIAKHAGLDFYRGIFTDEELMEYGIGVDMESPNGVVGVPDIDGTFHVSGIQALMRDNEALMNIRTLILPLMADERFASRIDPYKILKAIESRTNLKDEGIILSEDANEALKQQEQAMRAKQENAAAEESDLSSAFSVLDLAGKMSSVDATGGQQNG